MKISPSCVVALTWSLKDSQGELLDELLDPVEFLVGGHDLLPVLEQALQDHASGDTLDLYLEPERAFGRYDEQLVFLLPRTALHTDVQPGLLIEAGALESGQLDGVARDHLLTITDIYPDHVVLDGNHPLAGMGLRLQLKVGRVRAATAEELRQGSVGPGFFRLQATPEPGARTH